VDLVYLQDRSVENIDSLIMQLNPNEDIADNVKMMLTRAKNLHLIFCNSKLQGFINPKPDCDKGVLFCPIFLTEQYDVIIGELLAELTLLFLNDALVYCAFMNSFHLTFFEDFCSRKEPFDKSVHMVLSYRDFQNSDAIPGENLTFKLEALDKEKLLNLHLKAYASEPPYVVGQWDELIDNYLSLDNTITLSCKYNELLIGVCLGVSHPENGYNYIYSVCVLPECQGKGFGDQLMNRFVQLTASESYQLEVLFSNYPARKVYESIGFKETSSDFYVYKLN